MKKAVRTVALAGCVCMAACVTLQGDEVTGVAFHLDAPRGFRIVPSGVWRLTDRTVARGWVCRQRNGPASPLLIRVEATSPAADGALLSHASPLMGVAGRQTQCMFFHAEPRWDVRPGGELRICALIEDGPCPHTERDDRGARS